MERRDQILELARTYPGLHLRELARQADTSLTLVQYHISHLEQDGLVELGLDGGKIRVYLPDVPKKERPLLACLRDRKRLQVALTLIDHGPLTHAELASESGFGKSTLSFHLRAMEEVKMITRDGHAYTLVEPKRIRALLESYRPTPDAADRLAKLWDHIYG